MEETTLGPNESLGDIVLNQLNTLLAVIARPVVQQQILAIGVIFLVALLAPEAFRWWWRRRQPDEALKAPIPRWQQWVARLHVLYAPLLGLILTNGVIWLLTRQGYPYGLVEGSRTFFWLWLAYRAVLLGFYVRLGDSVKPYHRYVFLPIFLLVLLWQFLGRYVGLMTLMTVPIFTFGEFTLTLSNLINAMVLLYIFFVAAWIVERVLNRTLQKRFDAEPGKIRSLATLSRYAIAGLGIVASLASLGLDATSIGLVAGGLSVGIGIGMQDLVSNFVSGLTLLFDQSLRPGDVIEIDGKISEVERVSLRTPTVVTLDNIKMIIPNSTFTTERVTTLTKDDYVTRVLLPVRVAYETDPEHVKQIVEQTAAQHPQVLDQPAPLLLFRGVGTDSSLDFELAVWTDLPKFRGLLRSELYYLLFAAFAEHRIEIPIPKRDLNLRPGWENSLGTKPV